MLSVSFCEDALDVLKSKERFMELDTLHANFYREQMNGRKPKALSNVVEWKRRGPELAGRCGKQ